MVPSKPGSEVWGPHTHLNYNLLITIIKIIIIYAMTVLTNHHGPQQVKVCTQAKHTYLYYKRSNPNYSKLKTEY